MVGVRRSAPCPASYVRSTDGMKLFFIAYTLVLLLHSLRSRGEIVAVTSINRAHVSKFADV
jgi:hypothetical protein